MAANRLRGDKGDYHVTHCCTKPIVLVTARASIVLDIQWKSRASVANQNARKMAIHRFGIVCTKN